MNNEQQINQIQETVRLIESMGHELQSVRRQNEILRAKVEVMDFFACVLHTKPAEREQAKCVDVYWEGLNHVSKLKQQAVDLAFPLTPPQKAEKE